LATYTEFLKDLSDKTVEQVLAELRRHSDSFSRGEAAKFRGVSHHNGMEKWEARIRPPNSSRSLYLGVWSSSEEAARAYDRAAVKFRGSKALTNFSLEDYADILANPDGYDIAPPESWKMRRKAEMAGPAGSGEAGRTEQTKSQPDGSGAGPASGTQVGHLRSMSSRLSEDPEVDTAASPSKSRTSKRATKTNTRLTNFVDHSVRPYSHLAQLPPPLPIQTLPDGKANLQQHHLQHAAGLQGQSVTLAESHTCGNIFQQHQAQQQLHEQILSLPPELLSVLLNPAMINYANPATLLGVAEGPAGLPSAAGVKPAVVSPVETLLTQHMAELQARAGHKTTRFTATETKVLPRGGDTTNQAGVATAAAMSHLPSLNETTPQKPKPLKLPAIDVALAGPRPHAPHSVPGIRGGDPTVDCGIVSANVALASGESECPGGSMLPSLDGSLLTPLGLKLEGKALHDRNTSLVGDHLSMPIFSSPGSFWQRPISHADEQLGQQHDEGLWGVLSWLQEVDLQQLEAGSQVAASSQVADGPVDRSGATLAKKF
jgi:hypothetical protein